jgi:hypothetical protein
MCGTVRPDRMCEALDLANPVVDTISASFRRRRSRAIAAAVAGVAEWHSEHPDATRPPAEAFAPIRDGLASVKLAAMMAATGLAKSSASQVRSGRTVPHVRHWSALADLARVRCDMLDHDDGSRE